MRTAVYRVMPRFFLLLTAAVILAAVAGCGVQPPQKPAPTTLPTATPAIADPAPTQSLTATPQVATLPPASTPATAGGRGSGLQALTELPSEPATSFEPAPDRDLFQLAMELIWPPGSPDIPRVFNPEPVSYSQGSKESFWLIRFLALDVYEAEFELRLVTDQAYWYI